MAVMVGVIEAGHFGLGLGAEAEEAVDRQNQEKGSDGRIEGGYADPRHLQPELVHCVPAGPDAGGFGHPATSDKET